MAGKGLYIFVEGTDDDRFFERLIEPQMQSQYAYSKIVRYAQLSKKDRRKLIQSVYAQNADIIFVHDMDENPCVTLAKSKLTETYPYLDEQDITIVIREIESWYPAGLSDADMERMLGRVLPETDAITKERFDDLLLRKTERIDAMLTMLDSFSVEEAVKRNDSFRYFVEKYNLK